MMMMTMMMYTLLPQQTIPNLIWKLEFHFNPNLFGTKTPIIPSLKNVHNVCLYRGQHLILILSI